MPDKQRMQTTVDDYIAHMSAGDKEAWLDLFADGATVEDPVGTPPHVGREAIAAFWDLVRSLSDSLTVDRTGPIRCAGAEAAFPMQAHTDLGGTSMVVDIIDVFTFDDDHKIVGMRAFWDQSDMRVE